MVPSQIKYEAIFKIYETEEMTMERFMRKHKRTFVSLISIIFILPILISVAIEWGKSRLILPIIFTYLITFILCFLGFSLIIGFQFINPFSSNKILKFGCNFFLYGTLSMLIMSIIASILNINYIISEERGCFIFTGIYGSLGAFLASLFFKNKYNNRQ